MQLVSNTGIGFRMTSSRIYQEPQSEGPSPQCYDVCVKITPRQKKQNDLIAKRYKDWKCCKESCASCKFSKRSWEKMERMQQITSHDYTKNAVGWINWSHQWKFQIWKHFRVWTWRTVNMVAEGEHIYPVFPFLKKIKTTSNKVNYYLLLSNLELHLVQ